MRMGKAISVLLLMRTQFVWLGFSIFLRNIYINIYKYIWNSIWLINLSVMTDKETAFFDIVLNIFHRSTINVFIHEGHFEVELKPFFYPTVAVPLFFFLKKYCTIVPVFTVAYVAFCFMVNTQLFFIFLSSIP